MKSKKESLFVLFVFVISFSMFAQKPTTPVLKSNPPVQEKVSPTIKKDPPTNAGAPAVGVITSPVSNITATSAETGYTLSNAIGIVSRHGICLNRKPNPTTSGAIFTGQNTSGSVFTVQLTGLAPSTTFYIRAYATTTGNSTIYGNELSFTTPSGKK
jgi:hypothetical protein